MSHKLRVNVLLLDKPTYFLRTIPNISNQLKKLDEIVRTEFIPAIFV